MINSSKTSFKLIAFLLLLVAPIEKNYSQTFWQKKLSHHFKTDTPSWVDKRLKKDFSNLRRSLPSSHEIKKFLRTLKTRHEFGILQIKRGRVYLPMIRGCRTFYEQPYRIKALKRAITKILSITALPDIDLLVFFGDGIHETPPLPTLCFSKDKNCKNAILIPDPESLAGLVDFHQAVHSYDIAFDKKSPLAFWRGATTGGNYTLNNWKNFTRSKAVLFSLKNPDLLDAKFTTAIGNHSKDLRVLLKKLGAFSKFTDLKDQLKYKYLLDLDGNCCAYSRFNWILLSNSVCLKHQSNYEQWYYDALTPFKHYIPFASDFSDFSNILELAKKNPTTCKTISKEATLFAKQNLTLYPCLTYLYRVLSKYSGQKNSL